MERLFFWIEKSSKIWYDESKRKRKQEKYLYLYNKLRDLDEKYKEEMAKGKPIELTNDHQLAQKVKSFNS